MAESMVESSTVLHENSLKAVGTGNVAAALPLAMAFALFALEGSVRAKPRSGFRECDGGAGRNRLRRFRPALRWRPSPKSATSTACRGCAA